MEQKFTGLRRYFDSLQEQQITLSFDYIEQLIGEPLCDSARKYHAYWHPSKTHTITRCWVDNGYSMIRADLSNNKITFKKDVK